MRVRILFFTKIFTFRKTFISTKKQNIVVNKDEIKKSYKMDNLKIFVPIKKMYFNDIMNCILSDAVNVIQIYLSFQMPVKSLEKKR